MTAATFGDLLGLARGHLACAAAFPDNFLRGESAIAAAGVTRRLALTLSRYLADIVPYGMAEAITNPSLRPRIRAAVDAREALRMAANALRTAAAGPDRPGREPADQLVASLAAAGDSLAAGRDLLRTHFAASPDGSSLQQSDWSAVITSAPVTRAVATEVASWSQQLAFLMARLSQAAETHAAGTAAVRHGLASGCQWLLTASAAITAGQRSAPATLADASLLQAIPANVVLLRQPPGDGESAGELARGVAASAARLRVVTWGTAEQAAWSEAMTAESWRWTATGAAVTCHASQLLLGSLAGRPGLFSGMPEVALQLRAAGESAARACARWRDVASVWNMITTETRGLTAPGIPDLGDLVVGLGRLAFTDPGWTPARVRHSPLRDPAELAPGPAQFTGVVSAVHHAVSAVVSIAATDRRAVDVAVRASRLHVPTRTLPDGYDVPRKFANAVPSTTADLLDAYRAASAASDLTAADLDGLAATVGAPSRILGFARAAARLGPDMTFALTTDAGTTRMAGPAATRMPARPPARAATAPAPDDRELAASVSPGPAELAVRENGIPDLGLLMRASVIDKATRLLIAEVEHSADGLGASGQTAGDGRLGEATRSPARVASEGFPAGPVAAKAAAGWPGHVRVICRRFGAPPCMDEHHLGVGGRRRETRSRGRRQTESRPSAGRYAPHRTLSWADAVGASAGIVSKLSETVPRSLRQSCDISDNWAAASRSPSKYGADRGCAQTKRTQLGIEWSRWPSSIVDRMFECVMERGGDRPAWPGVPEECRSHHAWKPDTVVSDWRPCDCPAARAAHGGHIEVTCGTPGCSEVWQKPRHEPFRLPKILVHYRARTLASAGTVDGPDAWMAAPKRQVDRGRANARRR